MLSVVGLAMFEGLLHVDLIHVAAEDSGFVVHLKVLQQSPDKKVAQNSSLLDTTAQSLWCRLTVGRVAVA